MKTNLHRFLEEFCYLMVGIKLMCFHFSCDSLYEFVLNTILMEKRVDTINILRLENTEKL